MNISSDFVNEKRISMKTQKTVKLDMTRFGIKTLVGAKQKKIDLYLTSYINKPGSRFGGGDPVAKTYCLAYG
jgi:hypothetical protein